MLPTRGGKVIVVRGEEKGATGKLLAKNKEKETALVQVGRWAGQGGLLAMVSGARSKWIPFSRAPCCCCCVCRRFFI